MQDYKSLHTAVMIRAYGASPGVGVTLTGYNTHRQTASTGYIISSASQPKKMIITNKCLNNNPNLSDNGQCKTIIAVIFLLKLFFVNFLLVTCGSIKQAVSTV